MKKNVDKLRKEHKLLEIGITDFDFDLDVATGATFDYEKYETQGYVALSTAVCMLCNLGEYEPKSKSKSQFQWRQGGKDDYDDIYEHALNDIASGKLKSEEQEGIRVNMLEWIQWGKESGYPIPKQLEDIQPGRERQKQVTTNRNQEIQENANRIYAELAAKGKSTTKDSIIRELNKMDEYKNMSVDALRKTFKSPKNIK